jgi:hypothetical protein
VVERIESTRVVHVPPAVLNAVEEIPKKASEPRVVEPVQERQPEPEEPPLEATTAAPDAEPVAPDVEEGPARPEVDVTIGTIEVQLAPDPAAVPAAAASKPQPEGFAAYTGMR